MTGKLFGKWRRRDLIVWLPCALVCLLVVSAGFMLAMTYDKPVYDMYKSIDTGDRDWHRMFRVCGYLPVWLLMAGAYAMIEWPKVNVVGFLRAMTRPLILIVPVLISAGVVEVLKLVFRRERPNMHDGEYVWRSFLDRPLAGGGLGLPSSHAAIAFTAGLCLCWLFPRAWAVWLFLAIGCAATRVINHAHFVSDVYVSALLAVVVVAVSRHYHNRIISCEVE